MLKDMEIIHLNTENETSHIDTTSTADEVTMSRCGAHCSRCSQTCCMDLYHNGPHLCREHH